VVLEQVALVVQLMVAMAVQLTVALAAVAATLLEALAVTAVTAVVLAAIQEELLLVETADPVPAVRTLRTAAPQVVPAATLAVRSLAQVAAHPMGVPQAAVALVLVMP
jgi:hypothetical protein